MWRHALALAHCFALSGGERAKSPLRDQNWPAGERGFCILQGGNARQGQSQWTGSYMSEFEAPLEPVWTAPLAAIMAGLSGDTVDVFALDADHAALFAAGDDRLVVIFDRAGKALSPMVAQALGQGMTVLAILTRVEGWFLSPMIAAFLDEQALAGIFDGYARSDQWECLWLYKPDTDTTQNSTRTP